MAQGGDAELRFKLARIVELSRPRRVFAVSPTFVRFIGELDKLHAKLPIVVRRRLTDWTAAAGPLDPKAYVAACQRAADRAGLLACGDASVAVAHAPHLARLAASPRYLAIRRTLRR
jgi:hypothetical protein